MKDREPVAECWDCGVTIGEPHVPGCDVARCVVTGRQALQCMGVTDWLEIDESERHNYQEPEHPGTCDGHIFTGFWPGYEECIEFGWFVRWGPPWIPCDEDHPDAGPDLNRLHEGTAGIVWSQERQRWVKR